MFFNTYLKYHFFFTFMQQKFIIESKSNVSNENRDIYFKNLHHHIFPSILAPGYIGRDSKRRVNFRLRFFPPPVHFQSETDFVRQVSSCMLRCATSHVTRRRKRELWKFRRASTPPSLLQFAHWNSGRQVWRLI